MKARNIQFIYYIVVRPNKKMLMKCNNFEENRKSNKQPQILKIKIHQCMSTRN
jgi:hypothetical protein